MIHARVGSTIEVSGAASVLKRLRLALTFPNPEYRKGKRLGLKVDDVQRDLEFAEDTGDGGLRIPRGAAFRMMRIAREGGHRIEWTSEVVRNAREPLPMDRMGVTLRPYQAEAVEALVKKVQGCVVLPCGGGKTTVGAVALASIGEAAVVMVPTIDIADQWAKRIGVMMGAPVRMLAGRARRQWRPLHPGEVAVATAQSLVGEQADAVLQSCGVFLVDEVQHVAADQWAGISNRCPARWRWGLTATTERADGLDQLLEVLIGPVIYRQPAWQLIEWGFLWRPRILPVSTGIELGAHLFEELYACPRCDRERKVDRESLAGGKAVFCPGCRKSTIRLEDISGKRMKYSTAVSETSMNPQRLDMIAGWVGQAFEAGRRSLVLVGRKPQGAAILERLRCLTVPSQLITSKSKPGDRKRHVRFLQDGRIAAAVATSLADEGLDVPALDFGINDQGGKAVGRSKQRVGRFARPVGKEPPLFLEPVDAYETFARQWRSRRKGYRDEYGKGCLLSSDPVDLDEAGRILAALL